MAGAGGERWDKRQDFGTGRLIEQVDDLDALRGMLADDGTHPPKIRDQLLQLWRHPTTVINENVREDADEPFE